MVANPLPQSKVTGGSTTGTINLLADVALGIDRKTASNDTTPRYKPTLPSLASLTSRDGRAQFPQAPYASSRPTPSLPVSHPPSSRSSRHSSPVSRDWEQRYNPYPYLAQGPSRNWYDGHHRHTSPVGAVELLRPSQRDFRRASEPSLAVKMEPSESSSEASDEYIPPTETRSTRLRNRERKMENKGSEGTEVEERSRSESLNELEGKKKRTYVRRDVQRRKEQNAQAQKKFRWKKKVMAEQMRSQLDDQNCVINELKARLASLEMLLNTRDMEVRDRDAIISQLRAQLGRR